MSRLAKKPLIVPAGVEFKVVGREIHIKGKKGTFVHPIDASVAVEAHGNDVTVRDARENKKKIHAMVGTTYRLIQNMIKGVNEGFEQKLQLVGVGYRAKTQGKGLELSLGYSNPIEFEIPTTITADTPTNTEIIIKGIDKQIVGEISAKIRKQRPPECYKGKGIRRSDEQVPLKETKKK